MTHMWTFLLQLIKLKRNLRVLNAFKHVWYSIYKTSYSFQTNRLHDNGHVCIIRETQKSILCIFKNETCKKNYCNKHPPQFTATKEIERR